MADPSEGAPSPSPEPLLARRKGSLLILTLNRPDRLNAVSLPLYRSLEEELRRADGDGSIRCVVLTGAGRAFCVGADLKSHASGPPSGDERGEYVRRAQRVNRLLQLGGKPVVAAVNGHAIGAGLEMALSSDFMIVADDAKLRFPEISLGTFVGGGTVYTLAERVGVLKARELIYLGDFFRGSEAAEMGIAYRAVPTERVLEESLELAGRLARKAPISLAWAKRLIGPASTMSRKRALRLEAGALDRIMDTRDWAEGVKAFDERRDPEYVGE
jgi:enoyl-CoA hydratase